MKAALIKTWESYPPLLEVLRNSLSFPSANDDPETDSSLLLTGIAPFSLTKDETIFVHLLETALNSIYRSQFLLKSEYNELWRTLRKVQKRKIFNDVFPKYFFQKTKHTEDSRIILERRRRAKSIES